MESAAAEPAAAGASAWLGAILQEAVGQRPDAPVLSWMDDKHDSKRRPPQPMTFGQLGEQASAVATVLAARLSPGDRVLLVYPPGLEFDVALWGCALAGVIAVPVFPPNPSDLEKTLPTFRHIAQDCGAAVALTTKSYRTASKLANFRSSPTSRMVKRAVSWDSSSPRAAADVKWPKLEWINTDAVKAAPAAMLLRWRPPPGGDEAICYLQYTSGSTSEPKGVVITHSNIASQLELYKKLLDRGFGVIRGDGFDPLTVAVSWLPQYHDFGLVTRLLAVSMRFHLVTMAPWTFIRKPLRWLQALSDYRADFTAAPDFAYALTARKVTDQEASSIDLSNCVWSSGAEPIRASSMQAFGARFGRSGFNEAAFTPSYGLAEHVLGACVGGARPLQEQVLRVDANILASDHRVVVVAPEFAPSKTLFSLGSPTGVDMMIVSPDTLEPRGADEVGEVWLDSPSKARGYWGKPEATTATFEAQVVNASGLVAPGKKFLRTGDLGFLHRGELYLCGRAKDVLIIAGKKHY
eukprot:SAG31_NODE_4243_length_3424_cov_2.056842_1_plen_521_part_10